MVRPCLSPQVCAMLGALENYYWRYTSASELVNMILAFIETRAAQVSTYSSSANLTAERLIEYRQHTQSGID